jgi:Ni,Fe-hydrogenase I cytochrome b subunit
MIIISTDYVFIRQLLLRIVERKCYTDYVVLGRKIQWYFYLSNKKDEEKKMKSFNAHKVM